ncbi:MAG TPA: amidohydrolase family protein [Acidimicrobiia bacterium]|jgi:N-acyl-D-aspartate/D-glutamate deacylase|nr:amidohydrolase family protein [Acidimicrobiia bacterium]
MPHDLVIKGGTIVDGSGAERFTGDVAIDGDRIVEVGRVGGRGRRTIDADGLVVTPGFVDIHTHLDAQLSWDPVATSSCWHGVTSVVLGNCGVTFAPCRPADRAYLAELMESVEDIPAGSILAGLSWEWETYGDYLGEIDRLPKGVNVGGMVGHCAVRHHVMGERGLDDRPAPAEDVAAMADAVDEAMAAGALGFSTSRTLLHRVPDGRPVPGTWADTDELYAIGDVLGRRERGVFEVAPRFEQPGPDYAGTRAEVHWMAEIQRRTGRPVTFGVAQSDLGPELYKRIYECVDEEAAAGGVLRPQTTARGIGLLFGLANRTFFGASQVWRDLQKLDLDARVATLEDASRRELLIEEGRRHKPIGLDFRGVYVMRGPDAHYDYTEADSLEHHARVAGEDVVEAFVRISRETRGRALFSFPFLNQQMTAVEEMLAHPQTAIGLADSGAHVGLIMDAGLPTWFLSYWVRDRERFTLEDAVRRMTSDTASIFGVADRGALTPGAFADVNLIELDALALPLPEYVHDFPAGAGRYIQRGRGYEATVVNGEVFMEGGEHTGALTGVTLRSGPDVR